MILIYCKQAGARLNYSVYELFTRRLGVRYTLTTDEQVFRSHRGMRINYSTQTELGGMIIQPVSLLFEEHIVKQDLRTFSDAQWIKGIFPTRQSTVPFDVFAATFYLLSRYEEYLPHQSDSHGRFLPEEGFAMREQVLHLPLVDHWALQLKWVIENFKPDTSFQLPNFRFISTVDIDYVFRYKGIGFMASWIKLLASLLRLRIGDLLEQMRVGMTHRNDPYDTFEWIDQLCTDCKTELIYFALMRSGTRYDRNLGIGGSVFKNQLRKLSQNRNLGLHPSYYCFSNAHRMRIEKSKLEHITAKKILSSRQHYLRYKLPDTFQQLADAGITREYSTGFSAANGFRASTAHPFLFFNVATNTTTSLLLYPVTSMDKTFRFDLQLSPEEAYREAEKLMNEVKKVNGIYVHIWHNSNLSEAGGWTPWREFSRKLHTLAASKQQQEFD